MEDVKQHMGSVPIIDPGIVYGEICRRMPMGGQELQGIKKSQMIQKVIMDILEQPQISGQSKWEDRFLYAKCSGGSPEEDKKIKEEAKSWMKKSHKALSVQPREYEDFFTWMKGFENSPWHIEEINPVHRTIKVLDKGKDLLLDLTYDGAMNILRKAYGWSDADVFEYWDWKKSMMGESAEALFHELQTPGGYKLCYTDYGEDGGHVIIQKSFISNKSFVAPELRGREVVTVIHKSTGGSEIELGSFWGMDAMDQGYKLGKSFANKMAKLTKGDVSGNPQKEEEEDDEYNSSLPASKDEADEMGKGLSFDGSNLLNGDAFMLTMSVQDMYDRLDGLSKTVDRVEEGGKLGIKGPKGFLPWGHQTSDRTVSHGQVNRKPVTDNDMMEQIRKEPSGEWKGPRRASSSKGAGIAMDAKGNPVMLG